MFTYPSGKGTAAVIDVEMDRGSLPGCLRGTTVLD